MLLSVSESFAVLTAELPSRMLRLHTQVDVYSLGCIINECWTRQQPWRDSSHFFQVCLSKLCRGRTLRFQID